MLVSLLLCLLAIVIAPVTVGTILGLIVLVVQMLPWIGLMVTFMSVLYYCSDSPALMSIMLFMLFLMLLSKGSSHEKAR